MDIDRRAVVERVGLRRCGFRRLALCRRNYERRGRLARTDRWWCADSDRRRRSRRGRQLWMRGEGGRRLLPPEGRFILHDRGHCMHERGRHLSRVCGVELGERRVLLERKPRRRRLHGLCWLLWCETAIVHDDRRLPLWHMPADDLRRPSPRRVWSSPRLSVKSPHEARIG